MSILEKIEDYYPELLKADGFDDAILGISMRADRTPVIAYNYWACVEILMEGDGGMSMDDAVEYLDYNVLGSWVGENTPTFVEI